MGSFVKLSRLRAGGRPRTILGVGNAPQITRRRPIGSRTETATKQEVEMTGQLIIQALIALVVFQSLVIAFLTGVLALLTIFPRRLAGLYAWLPKGWLIDDRAPSP
jgi:hypothetical protein